MPALARTHAACPNPITNTDLWGGDLPGGTVTGTSFTDCCAKCTARKPECKAFTYVPSWKKCYLKGATGWAAKRSWLKQSWAEPRSEPTCLAACPPACMSARQGCSSAARPCTDPPLPPPRCAACGNPLHSTNLVGGDLPDGIVAGKTPQDCCRACQMKGPRCHGYTFVAAWSKCYLKAASGWTVKASLLMQSWVAPPPPSECAAASGGALPAAQPCRPGAACC